MSLLQTKKNSDLSHLFYPISDHLGSIWNASQSLTDGLSVAVVILINTSLTHQERKKCILRKSNENILEMKKDEPTTKESFKSKSFHPTENCIFPF